MKQYRYAWEKFYTALLILATTTGTLQERLRSAFVDSLMRLKESDLPEGSQRDFRELRERLTDVAATAGEGMVGATTAVMSDEDARELARTIVSLYNTIATKGDDL